MGSESPDYRMKLLGCLLLFCFGGMAAVHGQVLSYTFPTEGPARVSFREELRLFIDSSGQLSLAELLADSTLTPVDPREAILPSLPYYTWTSIQLTNPGPESQSVYLNCLNAVDSIWYYEFVDGRLVNQLLTGLDVSAWQKPFVHSGNLIPIRLRAGAVKTVYLRFYIHIPALEAQLPSLFVLSPVEAVNRRIQGGLLWNAFYLGFMALFSLLSAFMYRIFKDRVFLYFGGLMLSFGFYFAASSRVTDLFITGYYPSSLYFLLDLSITGIALSLTLFIINYLRLREVFPRFSRLFLAYVVVVQASNHLAALFALEYDIVTPIHNLLLLPWVVACFAIILLLAWRGQPAARMLLRTIAILFVGSALHVVASIRPAAQNVFTLNAFQLGTMIFAGALFYDLFTRIDTIRREKDRFAELDSLKSRFFANISHEFRTPLTLIMAPLTQLNAKLHEPGDRKLLGMMQRNAQQLLRLINQILDLSKLEAGKMTLQAREVNFPALLKGIVMSFESLAQQQEVRLHFASQEDELSMWVDPDKIEQIFNNLLSNAFKHTTVSEEVAVLLLADEWEVTVQVKDTGRGIPAEQLPQLFNRFFQADPGEASQRRGTGIGLALVKELVQLHGGTIDVQSQEGRFTTFTLHFPRGQAHLREQDLAAGEDIWMGRRSEAVAPLSTEPAHQPLEWAPADRYLTDKPLVLLIEDHADVRFLIEQHLRADYRVIEAVNGGEGIEKAWEFLPDLIISDVMMPDRNGYEVCRILKADQRSSHIPLILLTAKAAQEEKIQGLNEGADDYLVKPFHTQELLVRVRNLIESRRRLREQFNPATEGATIDPNLSVPDQEFLQAIYATIDNHLDNEQLSVDLLAEAVGMSRRNLNRKLSALTDLSANPFIRNYRLHQALRMLKERSGNVSEVALATGFSSTAYFVKCFREKFGQTPGSI
ncbi:MAG: response regulator [Lewinella sp.]|nr:response regulator [Lewinella sp.]